MRGKKTQERSASEGGPHNSGLVAEFSVEEVGHEVEGFRGFGELEVILGSRVFHLRVRSRFESPNAEDEATFVTGAGRYIFEYERALDVLMACALRRRKFPTQE